jgi:hypothetical protein
MRRFFCFWWICLAKARQGSAAFANEWQWLIGFPVLAALLWFFRESLSKDAQELLSGPTAFSTFMAALTAFFLTMLASFIVRFLIEPSKLFYQEKDRADSLDLELKRRFTPQIKVFLDPDFQGVTESPTEIQGNPPTKGPSSKWAQISVSCATDSPLVDCEAWLTSVRKIDGKIIGPQLVEEHIHCYWSQREHEKKITLPPLLVQRANLFALYENSQPLPIVPQTNPRKIRLKDAIQHPGSYQVEVLITAHGAPSFPASFIFEWHNFTNVTLTQK